MDHVGLLKWMNEHCIYDMNTVKKFKIQNHQLSDSKNSKKMFHQSVKTLS